MKFIDIFWLIAFVSAVLSVPTPETKFVRHTHNVRLENPDLRSRTTNGLPHAITFNGNPFTAVDTKEPNTLLPRRQHPLKPAVSYGNGPIQTNKFYANMLMGDQTLPAWVHPYELWKTTAGMAVAQVRKDQRFYGYVKGQSSAQYMANPTGLASVELGASEIKNGNFKLNVVNLGVLSATAQLTVGSGSITVPMALGMGFVTGIYSGLTPKLSSTIGFSSIKAVTSPRKGMLKYEVVLKDGITWVVYLSSTVSGVAPPQLSLSGGVITANKKASGLIVQIASFGENNSARASQVYDAAAGRYITGASVTAQISGGGSSGSYTLNYATSGTSNSGRTLLFALPHHTASFSSSTKSEVQTGLTLTSTVFGDMTAVLANSLTMVESALPQNIGFMPWGEPKGLAANNDLSSVKYSASVLSELKSTTKYELLSQDMSAQINVDSTYFSGKAFSKFALLAFTASQLAQDPATAKQGLSQLIAQFKVFANNKQQIPLAYDTTWRGIVSSAGLNGDNGVDFGNTYYNDHHFHYGYYVHAAAVIGALDNEIGDGTFVASVKPFVNALIRDVANPSSQDTYFPVFRHFDWFSGKSWAKGLLLSDDGKDEESSSEDYNFAYGMKLWGRLIGDGAMQSRGDLMLAIMRRSMNTYMLFSNGNTVMPSQIIGNKVSGILFENKVVYSTYFGSNPEYIHGIHMIPFTPISNYIRPSSFCQQEWNAKLASVVGPLTTGWKGVLEVDQALFSPQNAVNWLMQSKFNYGQIDGGMSRGWCLALAAAV
ncbi:glucan endo-1,3-beta-D-glucosidase 2 [Trichomonascus vanleenenianus]|uniref:glucan endo-1,3-beta-D-glucosidase n=1 Tax=Trichomonascus vanleenenianus TaxID=2268995 RepID=UPI003ECA181C